MTKGFRKEISMKLFDQYITIFFSLPPTSSHLNPLQVENCDSNSRLVVDEGDNGKFRPERVKALKYIYLKQKIKNKFTINVLVSSSTSFYTFYMGL